MGPIQSFADLRSLIWRRLPLIVTILVIGLLTSLYLAVTSPPSYEARSVIQVDAPVIADPVTRQAPPASLRVQQIEQRLMSRDNLMRLIERHHLFADVEGLPESKKIEVMRNEMRIESVATSTPVEGGSSLASIIISARAGTAQTAADIANDLAEEVVTSDRRDREARIAEAYRFLTEELARVETALSRSDDQISVFASDNEDSLPDSRTFQQTELAGLSQREALTEQSLMELQRDRLELERSAVTDDSASIVQQLRSAETSLAQARLTLPAGHPEIQRLQRTINELTQGGADVAGVGIGRQLSLIDSQLQAMQADLDTIIKRRSDIELAQSRAPQIIQTYEQMQRSRQNLRDQYAELSRRLGEIEALRLLSSNDQTENMVILEPAVPPEFPVASNRRRSAILGTFLSIAVAAGFALLLDMLNPVLRNSRQFEAVTGLRPIISLGYRPTASDRVLQQIRLFYVVLVLTVGFLAGLWMIDLMPQWLADLLPPSVRHGSNG